MSKRVLIAGLLAAVLIGSAYSPQSCVQFDGQSVLARRNVEADRLDLLLIYRDLHTTGDPAKGIEQLETIRDGARWFAFVQNFPLMLNLEEIAKQDRHADRPAASTLLESLVAYTTVRSGPLWTDSEGRLCGSQLVRVDELDTTLRATNAALREGLSAHGALEDFAKDGHFDDAESLRLLREALAADSTFIGLHGSAPYFTLPISDAGFVSMKRAVLDSAWGEICETCERSAPEREELHALIEFFVLNEWAIERSPGQVTFVLGDPHATAVELTAPPLGIARPGTEGVLARRSLVDALTPRGWTIASTDGEAAARAGFEAFTREP